MAAETHTRTHTPLFRLNTLRSGPPAPPTHTTPSQFSNTITHAHTQNTVTFEDRGVDDSYMHLVCAYGAGCEAA